MMVCTNGKDSARAEARLWKLALAAAMGLLLMPVSGGTAERPGGDGIRIAQAQPKSPWVQRRNSTRVGRTRTPSGSRAIFSSRRDGQATIKGLHRRAERIYKDGDLTGARSVWVEILELDPENRLAMVYMQETQPLYDNMLSDRKASAEAEQARRKAIELLESPVTIQTERAISLGEFMRLLSFSTIHEMEYYIAAGSDTQIFANFEDEPLADVLDTVLRPLALDWTLGGSNIVTVTADLQSRTYGLNTDEMSKLRTLLDDGVLQEVIWGQKDPPAAGFRLTLDDRQRTLVAVGAAEHMAKLGNFLEAAELATAPELETRIYKINDRDGPKIRAIVGAMISSDNSTTFDIERKIFIDEADMIIRDTPANLVKIEELLLDQSFINQVRAEELEIVNLSLIPREVESRTNDQVRNFTSRIVESVETLLYAREGLEAAQRQGRRMWFDSASSQMTLVDTPSNIQRVADYVSSLPELRNERRQKVVPLKHQEAENLGQEILTILGIDPGEGFGDGLETVTKRLRRGQTFTFKDLRITLIRVEGGDAADRFDDEAELSLVTGTQQSQLNVRELETQFFQEYEITAERVQPSGGGGGGGGGGGVTASRGEGSAVIVITYHPADPNNPGGGGGGGGIAF